MNQAKRKPRNKTVVLSVRLSEEEQAFFSGFCAQQGLTLSEAARRLIREAALLGPTFSGEARGEIVALTREVRAIGGNLNQTVRHINAGNIVQGEDVKDWLTSARDVIVELDDQYKSLCRRAHERAKQAVGKGAS
jgi:hypothetical protein